MAKVVIKVGNSSNIQLRNVGAKRAITFGDVELLINRHKDIGAVVIEWVEQNEIQKAIESIEALKNNGISIFLFNEFEGESIEDVGSRTGIKVAHSLKELQKNISDEIAIRVYTGWCDDYSNMESSDTDKSESLYDAYDENKTIASGVVMNKIQLNELFEAHNIKWSYSSMKKDVVEKNANDIIGLRELLKDVTQQKNEYKEKMTYTEQRLQSMIDIKASMEDEMHKLKEALDAFKSLESIEEPVPGAMLKEAEGKIRELKNKIFELQSKDEVYVAEKKVLEEKILKSKQEYEKSRLEIEDELKSAREEVESKNFIIMSLESEKKNSTLDKAELSKVKSEKAVLEEKVRLLEQKNKMLEEAEISDDAKVKELRDNIEQLYGEIEALNNELIKEVNEKHSVNEKLNEVTVSKSSLEGQLREKSGKILSLEAECQNLRSVKRSSEEKIKQLEGLISESEERIKNDEEIHNLELGAMQNKYSEELKMIKLSIDTKSVEVSKAKEEIARLKAEIGEKESELAKLVLSNNTAVGDSNNMRVTNEELRSKVDLLTRELMSTTSKLSMTEDANSRLERMNKKLKEKAKGGSSDLNDMGRQVFKEFKLKLNATYSGRGKIITVMGSGSYGVTTLAMSIARRFERSRVLYIDANTVNPKADGWFKKSPIIKEVNGVSDALKCSGLGLLVECGTDFVIDNLNKIIQPGIKTQSGTEIDYFSGIYCRINQHKLNNVDFSKFYEHIGNLYDYIIVDMGVIGSSEVADELMKMHNKIAYKSVVISLNDNCDIRNTNMKLERSGVYLDKTVWVLNMCENTKVCEMFKHISTSISPVILIRDNSIQGKGIPMSKVNSLKGGLDFIVEQIR